MNKMTRKNRTANFKISLKRRDFDLYNYGRFSREKNFSILLLETFVDEEVFEFFKFLSSDPNV